MSEQGPVAGGIRHNDRVLILGDTGAGKSEVINFFWELFRCQRLLLDSKDEFSVPDPLAEVREGEPRPLLRPTRDVDAIDWRKPIIHYIPRTEEVPEMDDLFAAAYDSPHPLLVALHETSDVCEYNANKAPAGFNRYVSKGRTRGKGLLAGSQLPVNIPVRAKTLNQHVLVLVPRFTREDDMKAIAKMCGQHEHQLTAQLDAMHDDLGAHSFVWFDRRERTLTACTPLDSAARARISITRRDDA